MAVLKRVSMQWSSPDECAPSLERSTQLVHDPDNWEEDGEEDEESQAHVQYVLHIGQIPHDLGARADDRRSEKV
ncbi:hypothetical protein PF005_g7357 [Phytophthora fragariae]|uniref:Uncharacterized protein n=1 Tax=Phytophthora fragariae TaxID=53985 RepID=A0A6A3YLB0_9STRA|nr:hypothetical protein PF003_g36056 [Phytophthora fragariae]KAE9081639.1 hypothetical protein PF010_g21909 [Phytophthora fragariae]KAE9220747.1 hypothetical protein PF005_g7357 [Phytophthora fragariae]KAE9242867.1 hypothetical protein PF004_g6417 [Phytophthora fragariae]